MAVVHYRLSTRVTDGRAEVLIRFVGSRTFVQRAKSRIICPVSGWDADNECVLLPKRITQEVNDLRDIDIKLNALQTTIYRSWENDQYDLLPGTWLQEVVDKFNNIKIAKREDRMLTSTYIREKYLPNKALGELTVKQYHTIANLLDRYGKKHPIYMDMSSGDVMRKFEEWLSVDVNNGRVIKRGANTINTKMKKLRTVYIYAMNNDDIADMPFGEKNGKYKVRGELYGDPTFLTIEERDALFAFQGLPAHLAVQRDIFIFQCHIGCRVSDLVKLTKENVTPDGFIHYIPQKTIRQKAKTVRVPISETAKTIIERYSDYDQNALLPFIHPNKYDEYIHEFMRLAGLDRSVIVLNTQTNKDEKKKLWEIGSSHLARRTFTQHIFEHTESDTITASFTGHSPKSNAFRRYIKATDKMKRKIIDRIESQNDE